ncbi:hypothetical protein SAMN05192589_112157 [Paracidovorax valerianellae]|uniref:Uncharacterized protein n=2 Tax=Paracidovorax valerianellae TaxID=187868 RepID=A0A1G7AHU9_9BURK|nr:hypothetical protein SAMN05192589_112157 [Paracidovorax valerianellae]
MNSNNDGNSSTPTASWRLNGTGGLTPWRERYAESQEAQVIASTPLPSAGNADVSPTLSATAHAALLVVENAATQIAAQAADAVRWKMSALQSRGERGGLDTAQGAESSEHTKPLEWTAAHGGAESTRPYTTDPLDLAVTGHTKPLEWTSALGGLQSTRPYTTDIEALAPFEHTKPLLLTDLVDGWEAIKPLEVSPSMASALNQSAALSVEGSAQQLLQAMAGFAPPAMGTAIGSASAAQAGFWNQAIAVGPQS